MSVLLLFLAVSVFSAVVGYVICYIRRDMAQSKLAGKIFTERVKVTIILHLTKELSDKLDRLGGASWVMDKIICAQVEDMPTELPHTPPPNAAVNIGVA